MFLGVCEFVRARFKLYFSGVVCFVLRFHCFGLALVFGNNRNNNTHSSSLWRRVGEPLRVRLKGGTVLPIDAVACAG